MVSCRLSRWKRNRSSFRLSDLNQPAANLWIHSTCRMIGWRRAGRDCSEYDIRGNHEPVHCRATGTPKSQVMARFLCLWDINNNSKITQKGKRDVEGNVKFCLPAAQRILIVPQYM